MAARKTIRKTKTAGRSKAPLSMSVLEKQMWEADGVLFIPWNAHIGGEIVPIHATWQSVQAALRGAYLEPVYLLSGNVLIVDEDGMNKRLHWNSVATSIARLSGVEAIVGDAVFVPKHLVQKVLG